MLQLLNMFKENFIFEITPTLALVFLFSGVFLLYFDMKDLKAKKLQKERRIVVAMGILYILISLAVFTYSMFV